MLIYLALCIMFNILFFFSNTIWKLRPTTLSLSPMFFIIFTSLVCYFATKSEYYNLVDVELSKHLFGFKIPNIRSLLLETKYGSQINSYIDEYFNNFISFDGIMSSICFIIFGIIHLDFPNNKQKIIELKNEIEYLKTDLGRSTIENRRLLQKNAKLLYTLGDSDIEDKIYSSQNVNPVIVKDPNLYTQNTQINTPNTPNTPNTQNDAISVSDSDLEYETESESDSEADPKTDPEADAEADTEAEVDNYMSNKQIVEDLRVLVEQLSKCSANYDNLTKSEIDKKVNLILKSYRNKINDIFSETLKQYPDRNDTTYVIKTIKKEIGKLNLF
jgi:hypothetical protein